MEVEAIALTGISMDGTQTRDSMDEDTVSEYQSLYKSRQAILPPLVVFRDDSGCWLADGFHRLQALIRLGGTAKVRCEVHAGGKREAIRYGFTANVKHGRRRTNADKRRAVRMALEDEEWGKMSDKAIAEMCAVSDRMVADVRETEGAKISHVTEPESEPAKPEKRTGKDGKEYPVKEKKPKAEPDEEQDEPESTNPPGWDAALEACQAIERGIGDAIDAIKAFEADPASVWFGRTSGKATLRIELEKAKHEVFTARPSEACGKCEKGCANCRKSGWLPRYMTTKNAKGARAD